MAVELGQALTLDIGPAIASLDKLGQASDLTSATIRAGNEAASKTFSDAAKAAVAYSNNLAAAQEEARGAAAATRSAMEAVRELSQANKELETARKATNSTTAEYQRLTNEIGKNNAKIREARQAILDNKAATEQEKAAVEAVRESRRQETNETKLAAAAARDAAAAAKQEAAAEKEAAAAAKQSSAASGEASGSTGFLGGLLGKASGLFAGLFAVNKLKQVGEEIIETTAEFERLEAVITTINGGDEAKGKLEFAALRQFTLRNPFEVKAVTEAYVQLRNRGISPTLDQLQSLADLAAASGKSFDQVTEGLLGATTGQYRRLKEFGVTAKQQGDTVAFTFRGVTTVVQKSQEAIADYVLGLGQLNGVAGATERIMNTTGGRITNLKDSFTELFATIGEGTDGPLNGFIKGLTKVVTNLREAIKSVDQKATDQVAKTNAVNDYGVIADQIFAQARQQATKEGIDVAKAIQDRAAQQQLVLSRQLADAEARAAKFNLQNSDGTNNQDNVAFYHSYTSGGVGDPGGKQYAQDQLAAVARVKSIRGEIAILQERAAVAIKGGKDEADQLGLIEALQAKIKQEEEDRAKSTSRPEIHKLNLKIIADQKELDALLEKQARKRADTDAKLQAALRALYAERATLQSLAAKAAIKDSDDQAEKARLNFAESLRQVEVIKQKLIEREAAVRKAGGRGKNADGVIDGAQDAGLAALRTAALDAYYAELYKIEAAREQRLFDLRADSAQKEVEEVNRKYDKLLAAQHIGQSAEFEALDEAAGIALDKARKRTQEEIAIEEARQRELLALRFRQQQAASDQVANMAAAQVQQAGATFGEGTGVSVIEAKEAEKRALLEIEKKHAQDVLNNSLLLGAKEGELARAQAQATIASVGAQLTAIDQEKAKHKGTDGFYKLIFGENDSDELRSQFEQTATQVIGTINQILSAQLAAEQAKVQAHQDNITSLQAQLSAEIQLNAEGSASNIKATLDQIAAEKAAKKEALAQSREIAKQQQAINDLQAISAIGLAVANIIAGWSTVPIAGSILGIVAAAATVASFVATKASARSAAQTESFFKGGLGTTGYTGDGNPHDESRALGRKDYTYHRQEFILPHEVTQQFRRSLLEPLHTGRHQDINWDAPEMRALLPDLELPGKMRAEKAAYVEHHHRLSMEPMRADFDRMHDRLAAIEGSNREMADKPDAVAVAGGYLLTWPNGSTKLVKVT